MGERGIIEEIEIDRGAEKSAEKLVCQPIVQTGEPRPRRKGHGPGIGRRRDRADRRDISKAEKPREISRRLRIFGHPHRVDVRWVDAAACRREAVFGLFGRIGLVDARHRHVVAAIAVAVHREDGGTGGLGGIRIADLPDGAEGGCICRGLQAAPRIEHRARIDDDHGDGKCEHERAGRHHGDDAAFVSPVMAQQVRQSARHFFPPLRGRLERPALARQAVHCPA